MYAKIPVISNKLKKIENPNFETLIEDSRVFLITCLRDPLKRSVSNFNYAYYSGYTDCTSYEKFAEKPNVYMANNYYTRIFSNNERLPLVHIGKKEYLSAVNTLMSFDLVLSTNRSHMDLFTNLNEFVGWDKKDGIKQHATFGDYWKIINMIKKLEIRKLFRYIRRKNMAFEIEYIKNKSVASDGFSKSIGNNPDDCLIQFIDELKNSSSKNNETSSSQSKDEKKYEYKKKLPVLGFFLSVIYESASFQRSLEPKLIEICKNSWRVSDTKIIQTTQRSS